MFFLGIGNMEPVFIGKNIISKIRSECPCQVCKKCGKKHPGKPCPEK